MPLSQINPFASKELTLPTTVKSRDQIEVGIGCSHPLVDGIRNISSIPGKILLWDSSLNSGNVSEKTIEKMKDFLHENNLHDVYVSVNEYNPKKIWQRTFSNPNTSLLSKCTAGVVNALMETLTIPKLTAIMGDHYSPTSNSVHLYSDNTSIALHECGHAKDINSRENPTLYTLTCNIPYVGPLATLYLEAKATENAIDFIKSKEDTEELKKAYTILTPAFATYVAGAAHKYFPALSYLHVILIFLGLGHLIGRIAANSVQTPIDEKMAEISKAAGVTKDPADKGLSPSNKIVPKLPVEIPKNQQAAPAA